MDETAAGPVLAEAQRRLQHAILVPEAPAEEATAMLEGTERLGAAQRLEIYRNGYRRRLLEAMGHLHPALRHMLGEELFDDFASGYLDARPSRSYTLADLDAGFADHLSANRPDAGAPEAWIDTLIDLARYERVFAEVYDGPGTEEDAPPESPPGVPASPDELTAVLAPCLRTFRATAAVHEYHAAVRRGADPAPPLPWPTCLAVWRRDYRVRVGTLTPQAHDLLGGLLDGATVGRARAAAALGPAEALEHLREWSACGWVRALAEPPRTSTPRQESME